MGRFPLAVVRADELVDDAHHFLAPAPAVEDPVMADAGLQQVVAGCR